MKIFRNIKDLRHENNTAWKILIAMLAAVVILILVCIIKSTKKISDDFPAVSEPQALTTDIPGKSFRQVEEIHQQPEDIRKHQLKKLKALNPDWPEDLPKTIHYNETKLTEKQEAELNKISKDKDVSWHIGKEYGLNRKGIRITTDNGDVYFIPILEATVVGLLETEGGRTVLRLSVLSILFILFLLTWRSTKKLTRPRKERIIETRVIAEDKDALHKSDIRPYYTQEYKDSLNEKYNYYGPEGDQTWITWVYNDIKSRKLDNSNEMMLINQLRFGWILNLMDYDYYLECISKTGMTYGEIERLVDNMEFQQQEKRKLYIVDEQEQECRSFKSSEEYENFLKSHEPEVLTDGEGIAKI